MATQTVYGNLVNYTVFPSENEHDGATEGSGRVITESILSTFLYRSTMDRGGVISGFTLPGAGAGLSGTIAAGTAIVEGYYITGTSTVAITFTNAATNWVFLTLEFDGDSKLLRPVFNVNDAALTIPEHSIVLGKVVCSGGNITSSTSYASSHQLVWGSWDGLNGVPIHTGSCNWSGVQTGSYPHVTVTITFDTPFVATPPIHFYPSGMGDWDSMGPPTKTVVTAHGPESGSPTTFDFFILG